MRPRHPAIEHTNSRSALPCPFNSICEIRRPSELLLDTLAHVERCEFLGATQFGNIVQNINRSGQPCRRGEHEDDDPVVELKPSCSELEKAMLGKLVKAIELPAVAS